MSSIISVSFLVALIIGCTSAWTYSQVDHWPETCQTGKRQSPVALWRKTSRETTIPFLEFKNHKKVFQATTENNGHTVEIQILDEVEDDKPILSGGNLPGEYVLDSIHFHWDSEHTINGKRYPLEGHYVHYKKKYGSKAVASEYSDGIVVLGVMFQQAKRNNKKLKGIAEATEELCKQIGVRTKIKTGLKIDDILPKNRQKFYKYEGSLTTPNCNEVVTWIVFEDTLPIGENQLKKISDIVTSTGEPLTTNYRPLQVLGAREILYSQG